MHALIVPLLLVACAGSPDVGVPAPLADPPSDPLPSWNAGPSEAAIVAFVEAVTTPGPDFVEPAERIAVFDNDGTLWTEHPFYIQAVFIESRVFALAPEHPEWQTEEPFASVLKKDPVGVAKSGGAGFVKLMGAVQGGLSDEEYGAVVDEWLASARHPRFDQPYTSCVYQPMLELLDYLRAHDFQTWIVSGGEQEFMRQFAEEVYGIPPEQVVGTRVKKTYQVPEGGEGRIVYEPTVEFYDDGPAKPVAIATQVGRRPLMAFGNSDGDREMLEWTTSGDGKRLAVYVRHTDEVREWAYDRESHIGHLDVGLDQALREGWTVIDMKSEWSRVFPFAP